MVQKGEATIGVYGCLTQGFWVLLGFLIGEGQTIKRILNPSNRKFNKGNKKTLINHAVF
jgi:hypothetical protein